MKTVVHQCQEIVWNHAFKGIAIEEAKAEPEAVELGAAKESLASGLKVVVEIADEIDAANFGKRKLLVFAIGREQVEWINLAKARGVEVATQGFAVEQGDDDLLVGRGWGAQFQSRG